ncbi:MAG TPA: septal ring lytic transglycosylase RlpA family protein [Rhodopila sp.]|uniref:septal ring lytic transglycosylase RlpA family protein n=1 Tax=Rhodopila sp. TaxID=2480087 RepID=UPI002B8341CC|nr:septal ring lytic transglycosylase RlpA family protein [Rhodopila sp.]HVY15169.1 septal ring lytic transglycosylase RlpA family protein [Rhodopila sp.]
MAIFAASAALILSQPAAMARTRPHPHHVVTPVAAQQHAANATWVGETGKASYYSSRYNGRITSSGQRFSQNELTAAHAWLPFGTKIRVYCQATGRSVIVTVTDRIYSNRRILDLSRSAAQELGIIRRGVAKVSLTPV